MLQLNHLQRGLGLFLRVVNFSLLETKRYVFLDTHVRKECVVLKDSIDRSLVRLLVGDVVAPNKDAPCAWSLQAGNHPQGRGLATTRWAEQRKEFPGGNLEVEVFDRNKTGELLANTLKLEVLTSGNEVCCH